MKKITKNLAVIMMIALGCMAMTACSKTDSADEPQTTTTTADINAYMTQMQEKDTTTTETTTVTTTTTTPETTTEEPVETDNNTPSGGGAGGGSGQSINVTPDNDYAELKEIAKKGFAAMLNCDVEAAMEYTNYGEFYRLEDGRGVTTDEMILTAFRENGENRVAEFGKYIVREFPNQPDKIEVTNGRHLEEAEVRTPRNFLHNGLMRDQEKYGYIHGIDYPAFEEKYVDGYEFFLNVGQSGQKVYVMQDNTGKWFLDVCFFPRQLYME